MSYTGTITTLPPLASATDGFCPSQDAFDTGAAALRHSTYPSWAALRLFYPDRHFTSLFGLLVREHILLLPHFAVEHRRLSSPNKVCALSCESRNLPTSKFISPFFLPSIPQQVKSFLFNESFHTEPIVDTARMSTKSASSPKRNARTPLIKHEPC